MPTFHCCTDCFKNSFFSSTLNYWYKLDETIRNSDSILIFKSRLSLICPLESNVFNIFDPIGLKFLTRLRLGFSHLNNIGFDIIFNPLCSRSLEIDDTSHFLLHCYDFSQHRIDLINSVKLILENFESLSDSVKSTDRFSGSIFN